MYAKKITCKDFNGNEYEDEYLFNISESELLKWMQTDGGFDLSDLIHQLQKERNGKKIMELFESFLKMTYGEKSLDGRQFIKTEEVWNRFRFSNAYDVLFREIVLDAKKGAEFINNVIPSDVAEAVIKALKENPDGIPDEMKDYIIDTKPTE